MSLWATATAAVDRHRPPRAVGPLREHATRGAEAVSAASDVAAQLIRYIPSELVAAYATVVGVLPVSANAPVCRSDFAPRWAAFAVFAALTPLTLQILYIVKRRKAGGVGPQVPWVDHVAPWSPSWPGRWCYRFRRRIRGAAGIRSTASRSAPLVLLLLGLASQLVAEQR